MYPVVIVTHELFCLLYVPYNKIEQCTVGWLDEG